MRRHVPFLEAVAVVVGTIIGAGIIGVPYVFAASGFLTSTFVLVLVGASLLFVRLMLGEVIMRTDGVHQLTGYTGIYAGRFAQHAQALVLVVSIYGTLLAYMIGQGEVLSALLGGPSVMWALLFYLVFSFLVVNGLDVIKRSELIMIVAIFFIMIALTLFTAPGMQVEFLGGFDASRFFVPFGVILFACAGLVSVPEAWRVVKRAGREDIFKAALIWGGVIPPVLYLLFAVLVVGVTGPETSQVATVSLGEALGPHMIIIGNVFAFFTVATSFLTIALAQRDIFRYDYSVPSHLSSALVLVVPLMVFALGMWDFIAVISIVGALMVGVNGIVAVIIYWRARTRGALTPAFTLPSWLAAPASVFLVAVFAAGILSIFV